MDKAHEAARTIAALLHFTAVGIVDPVTKVSLRGGGGLHQQQLVAADAEMAISQLPCPLWRKNMTLSASHDEGGTWADELTVHAGPSGYSSLAWLPAGGKAGLLGLLYEKSSDGKEPIDFQEVELAIISGAGAVA